MVAKGTESLPGIWANPPPTAAADALATFIIFLQSFFAFPS